MGVNEADGELFITSGSEFIRYWNYKAAEVKEQMQASGFNAPYTRPIKVENNAMAIALIHSELSEALEGLRHGNTLDDKIPEFTSAEAELADAVIRIMHLSVLNGWDVGSAIIAKMKFNATREHMHGGKLF